MAPKRKNEDSPAQSGRDKKKHKTAIARTIAVQSTSTTNPPQNAVAGPSRTAQFDTGPPLPDSIDVERFAEARAFEIDAMHTAMQTARASGTSRAWQQLPRHLRRRAASHDVRRVPLRLREKAKAEMDAPKAKLGKKKGPQPGKKKKISQTAEFLKRQKDKVWLETHIWHAKRMHMDNMWGYRLAVSPTEKSFRPSHRASVHGSILHDASYLGLIELKGPESILRRIFDSCCDLQSPSPAAKRYLAGARACDTHMYRRNSYPFGLIAPVTVLWRPLAPAGNNATSGDKNPDKQSRKGKEREAPPSEQQRVVWMWVHPSVYDEVYVELRVAGSFALEQARDANPDRSPPLELEMADLREQLNVFEIMGPKSSQVIKGALKPVLGDKREEFKKCWDELTNLQSTASIPRNAVLGFTVYDPRLSFPPKNAKVEIDRAGLPSTSQAATAFYPTSVLAQSTLWDEQTRRSLTKPKFKKKELDARRSKNLVPGTKQQALHDDDRVPVMLIQRSVEVNSATSAGTSQSLSHSPAIHGWTLIMPSGWAMPFLSSLIYTGTRVGGQRERQTQAFEAGTAYFPRDYPCTESYEVYSNKRAEEEEGSWDRKPPAKRPNYTKLGTRSPWIPDWEVVLGLQDPPEESGPGDVEDQSTIPGPFVPAQREDEPEATDVDMEDAHVNPEEPGAPQEPEALTEPVEPWLLRGPDTLTILDAVTSATDKPTSLLEHINKLRQKRGGDPLGANMSAENLWKCALVRVRLRLCGRGCPQDLAVIYGMDDAEALKWVKAEQTRKKGITVEAEGVENGSELSIIMPAPDAIIGYVTTGSYSLSLGEGSAVGAIPVARLMDLKEQAKRLGASTPLLVKVRDRHEAICRAARIEVLE